MKLLVFWVLTVLAAVFIADQRRRNERAAIAALIAKAHPSANHGGTWSNGIISVDELCDAMGIERPDPTPPPMTEAEKAAFLAALDDIKGRQ